MQQQNERAVSVHDEPFHKTVFQNEYVRVMDVEIPPHQATLFHTHAAPLVGVVVHDERNWEQLQGKNREETAADAERSFFDNSAMKLPYTHRVGNEGNAPIHYLAAEWLGSPKNADARAVVVQGRKLEKDVPTARVYRIKLPPAGATEEKVAIVPGLIVVFADPSKIRTEGIKMQSVRGGGAQWAWRDAGASYSIVNLGQKELEIVEIDWK